MSLFLAAERCRIGLLVSAVRMAPTVERRPVRTILPYATLAVALG